MKRHKNTLILLVITLLIAALAVPATASNNEQAAFEQPILVVNTSYLNIRTGPSARFSVLTTVAGGTELPVLGVAGDGVWYQVAVGNQAAWVNAEFTVGRGAFQNVPLVTVDIDTALPAANVGSSTTTSVISPVAANTNTSTATTGGDFIIAVPLEGEPPADSQPDVVAGEPASQTGSNVVVPQAAQSIVVINTSFLNVRSGPGAQFTKVVVARGGTEYPVLGIASDGVWFLVQTPAGQGWVNNEFVLFRGAFDNVPIVNLNDASGVIENPIAAIGSSVQLYAAPGTNLGLLGSVVGPVNAPIVARTPNFDWVQINTNVGFGWVLADQVTIRGDASLIPVVS